MADWQRRLDLRDVWGTEDVQLIAKAISDRLHALDAFGVSSLDDDRDELALWFDDLASDPEAGAEEFDDLMDDLYDWAEEPDSLSHGSCTTTSLDEDAWNGRKVCWIATF